MVYQHHHRKSADKFYCTPWQNGLMLYLKRCGLSQFDMPSIFTAFPLGRTRRIVHTASSLARIHHNIYKISGFLVAHLMFFIRICKTGTKSANGMPTHGKVYTLAILPATLAAYPSCITPRQCTSLLNTMSFMMSSSELLLALYLHLLMNT